MSAIPLWSASRPQNDLLAALARKGLAQIRQHVQLLFVPCGRTLYEPATNIDYVYFPSTAIISLSYVLTDGTADAVALIGREGFVGIDVILRSDSAPYHALVQRAGLIYRITCRHLFEACERNDAMNGLLLRYAQLTMRQLAQLVACNRHHPIDQQLCRWLLLYLDRVSSNDFAMTQEHIANMLGVRRESVTAAALKLQLAGLIRYQRGHISVINRAGLEARSCECYRQVRRDTDRLLELAHRYTEATSAHARQWPMIAPNGFNGEKQCYIPLQSY